MKRGVLVVTAVILASAAVLTAAVVEYRRYLFSGVANTALQNQIEDSDCVAGRAVNHANNQLGIDGTSDALDFTAGQCPLQHINVRCFVDSAGDRKWEWEYATREFEWGPQF